MLSVLVILVLISPHYRERLILIKLKVVRQFFVPVLQSSDWVLKLTTHLLLSKKASRPEEFF